MPADLWAFRERAGRAAAKPDRGCTVGDADCYTPIADAVIAEFAKPTDAMIDAAMKRSVSMRIGQSTRGEPSAKP
jgi:hypothetical protein